MAKNPEARLQAEARAQRRVLDEVGQTAPEVLEDLLRIVFPVYQRKFEQLSGNPRRPQSLSPRDGDEEIEALLLGWQQSHNLETSWTRHSALATLEEWTKKPPALRLSFDTNPFIRTVTPEMQDRSLHESFEFVFRHQGWNPFQQNWDDAENGYEGEQGSGGLRGAFEEELQAYKLRMERLAGKYDGFSVHKGYDFDGDVFYCLVRYQVQKVPFSKLPEDLPVRTSPNSLADRIKRLAAFIYLPLRAPSKGGRPPTRSRRPR